jgi:hypothetical protein
MAPVSQQKRPTFNSHFQHPRSQQNLKACSAAISGVKKDRCIAGAFAAPRVLSSANQFCTVKLIRGRPRFVSTIHQVGCSGFLSILSTAKTRQLN